ncbi:MAG: Fe-S cluster assembly protein SufD [Bacteroidetes bacterium]|nr:Fe-S cluster assembly protein SufD [Bacteroidota bacterium]
MGLTENITEQFDLLEHPSGSVSEVKKAAWSAFRKLGIPSVRDEEWKYTHIKTKLPETLTIKNTAPSVSNDKVNLFENIRANRLVFVNGIFQQNLSSIQDEKGLTIGSLKEHFVTSKDLVENHFGRLIRNKEEHFAALNTAFVTDGAFIHIAKGARLNLPIFIIHVYDAVENFIQSRNLIIAEESSSAQIVVDFQNIGNTSFYNHVSEVFVGKNAALNVSKFQTTTANTTAVHTIEAEVKRDGKFTCNTISFEGKLIRNNTNVSLIGENAEVHLNGLYYATGTSLIDNHLCIDHIVPNCQSNQLYKGIIDEEGTGVFNGKIFVKQDAQKTNAFQSSKTVLLSKEATMNSKPQLEIFADDVKCSHGAAIGQLDGNEIFYLKARGIEENDAKAILTYAFANQIIQRITIKELREYLDRVLKARLKLEL